MASMAPTRRVTLLALAALGGCATLQQVMALRDVDFAVDRVVDVRLAGVRLDEVRRFEDLRATDAARLLAAVAERTLPLELDLHLTALNPADNTVDARLVRMDWTFLIEDRETLSGVLEGDVVLPPGEPRDVPVPIAMDLFEFFDGSARDLFEIARSLAGQGGEARRVALRASPVVQTALGPIRYPSPITIVERDIGR